MLQFLPHATISHWLQAHLYVHLFCEMDSEMVERCAFKSPASMICGHLHFFRRIGMTWGSKWLQQLGIDEGSYAGIEEKNKNTFPDPLEGMKFHPTGGFRLIYIVTSCSPRLGVMSTLPFNTFCWNLSLRLPKWQTADRLLAYLRYRSIGEKMNCIVVQILIASHCRSVWHSNNM